jgi:hypothetical protein
MEAIITRSDLGYSWAKGSVCEPEEKPQTQKPSFGGISRKSPNLSKEKYFSKI